MESLREILSRPAPEAVDGFMARWHGSRDAASEPLVPPGFLPPALRRFYARHGTAANAFGINRLLGPDEVGEDDGHVVFYVEEQGVYLWGIATEDLRREDPPVWCRENDPGRPWLEDAPSVSVFLVQMLVMSAALSGPHAAVAAHLSPAETGRALHGLARLGLPPWHWPGYPARWYAGDEVVAFTCPNAGPEPEGEPDLSVWVSALNEEALRFLEPHLTSKWDYYSPRDG